ncbi:hypothetical protein [Streptomyces mirabilis]|uniref:hypothetical protein n=1 Tax=Streptomyces mirabilis TaxID=68239 RepID=UPI0036B62BDC
MNDRPERENLPVISVHGVIAENARLRVASLLAALGVEPGEAQQLIAAIQAGAVEGTQCEIVELDGRAPQGSSEPFEEGWFAAVQTVGSTLTHIADRTVSQARTAAAAPAVPPTAPRRNDSLLPTTVDEVSEEQVRRVLDVAERIFVSMTGHTGYSREMSEEILTITLTAVSAEEQHGYIEQLEAFAEQNRERLATLYRKYGPGGQLAEVGRSDLVQQPESIVICERLDTYPMWLQGVWDGELEESLLERFIRVWRYGLAG